MANARNERSVNAAKRLGFQLEGILRWHRVLPEGKEGDVAAVGEQADGKGPGRDTAMLAICWDDWGGVVREKIQNLVRR